MTRTPRTQGKEIPSWTNVIGGSHRRTQGVKCNLFVSCVAIELQLPLEQRMHRKLRNECRCNRPSRQPPYLSYLSKHVHRKLQWPTRGPTLQVPRAQLSRQPEVTARHHVHMLRVQGLMRVKPTCSHGHAECPFKICHALPTTCSTVTTHHHQRPSHNTTTTTTSKQAKKKKRRRRCIVYASRTTCSSALHRRAADGCAQVNCIQCNDPGEVIHCLQQPGN